jgi:hypothetical protein
VPNDESLPAMQVIAEQRKGVKKHPKTLFIPYIPKERKPCLTKLDTN